MRAHSHDLDEGRDLRPKADRVESEDAGLMYWPGTRRGLAKHVRLLTGGEVEITDSGGCIWSQRIRPAGRAGRR